MHDVHPSHGPPWVALLGLVIILAAYWAGALRLRQQGKRWSYWRGASFTLGVALLLAALSPPLVTLAGRIFPAHMVQHLLLGMLAPLPLALAAPVTLLLATLSGRARRPFTRLLHARPVRLLASPVTTGLLDIGGLYVLYLTPVYAAMVTSARLHTLVMLHLFVAGYLFTWSLAGRDPAPGRPSLRTRLIVLILAAGAHATLSKLIYAHGVPGSTSHSLAQIQAGAQVMYYGGDLAELLLAVALFAGWYRARGRRDARLERAHDAVW